MRLSVLDQSPIRQGGGAQEALRASIELAQAADRLGYTRYWVAEHHNTRTMAGSAPELLIPLLAEHTSRIRIGSGGVMLTHYSPLKVAELFRWLEALHPGRIDMGLGRAPGSDQQTARALKHGPGALPLEAYPQQVADLLGYLTNSLPMSHPFRGVEATPIARSMPVPWLLGSSGDSAEVAAELGTAFSFAHFINPDGGQRIVERYRQRFQPSPWLSEPLVNIGVSALCANTAEEARRLGLSRHLMRLRWLKGAADGVPSVEEALSTSYTEPELDYIRFQQRLGLEGEPEAVRDAIIELAASYGVDEVMVVTITHHYADRLRSYELLAAACGLSATP